MTVAAIALKLQLITGVLLLISCLYVCGQQASFCSNGFESSLSSGVARNGRQYIFPFINFTCHGNVTLWSFFARANNNQQSTLYPEFQIWRPDLTGSSYTKVAHTNISENELVGSFTGDVTDELYTHNLSVSGPMTFQPGDIVGVYTPRGSGNNPRSRLRLRFNTQPNGPDRYFLGRAAPLPSTFQLSGSRVNTNTQDLPEISAQVVIFQTTSFGVSSTTTTVIVRTLTLAISTPLTSTGVITLPARSSNRLSVSSSGTSSTRISSHGSMTFSSTAVSSIAAKITTTEEVQRSIVPNNLSSTTRVTSMSPSMPATVDNPPKIRVTTTTEELYQMSKSIGPDNFSSTTRVTSMSPSMPATVDNPPKIRVTTTTEELYQMSKSIGPDNFSSTTRVTSMSPSMPATVDNPPIIRVTTTTEELYQMSKSIGPHNFSSTTRVTSMSPSMPGTVDNSQSSSSALIVAVAVGVIAAVVLIVSTFLLVILAVCIRKAKRKKNSYIINTTTPTFNNPTYDTSSNGNFTNGHGFSNHSFETSANLYDYAQPVPLNHDTTGVQLTKASHDYQDPVYADPELEESCLNGIYESTSTDLQWGLYVPTLQQRSTRPLESTQTTGSGNENDIYSFIYSTLDSSATRPTSEAFFEERDIYWNPSSNPEELYSQLSTHKYREIIRQQIKLFDELGSGEFGTVHKGVWHSPGGPVDVAVKMLKEGAKEKDRVKFLQEAAINGQFHHPSIIKLQGVVTVGEPVMIVLELMPHGDLRSYLSGLKPSPGELTPPGLAEQCLLFCRQVCSGMRYLSSKSFVHRDLAARNILVSKNKTCKIADFGMARDIEESDYYVSHGGKVPVKWTAPEALNYKKYSSASDVWSFGALMYEIWSLGHKPFEKYSNIEVNRLVSDGFRLPPPPGCPQEIYTLMIQCWHPESSSRPTFSDLVTSFNEPDSKLLTCPSDVDPPEAVVLGAPLEMGENLYQELQNKYQDLCNHYVL